MEILLNKNETTSNTATTTKNINSLDKTMVFLEAAIIDRLENLSNLRLITYALFISEMANFANNNKTTTTYKKILVNQIILLKCYGCTVDMIGDMVIGIKVPENRADMIVDQSLIS
jgi:hypothetical protein